MLSNDFTDDFLDLEDQEVNDEDFSFSVKDRVLLLDGDIILYKPCCIFNEDTEEARFLIANNIRNKINELMSASEAESYRFFVTTNKNFRDYITDDYKANRKDVVRPVNLAWAKHYCKDWLKAESIAYLEADDLLHIHQTDDTVIWSLDKDLRQVQGMHIDDATKEVIYISELGEVTALPKNKYYFTGYLGLMFQCLTGDSTDHIIGCGIRTQQVYKTGAKAGQSYMKRKGVSPKIAYNLLKGITNMNKALGVVIMQYELTFGSEGIKMLEQQARLLYMVREFDEDSRTIKLWSVDDREEFMNLKTGEIYEL